MHFSTNEEIISNWDTHNSQKEHKSVIKTTTEIESTPELTNQLHEYTSKNFYPHKAKQIGHISSQQRKQHGKVLRERVTLAQCN